MFNKERGTEGSRKGRVRENGKRSRREGQIKRKLKAKDTTYWIWNNRNKMFSEVSSQLKIPLCIFTEGCTLLEKVSGKLATVWLFFFL